MSSTTGSKQQQIMIITDDERLIDLFEKGNNKSLLQQISVESEVIDRADSDRQFPMQPLHKKNKTNNGSLICVICGSSAHGYNFGVIACESCKAFFRRNALKDPAAFPCRHKRACRITSETRRNCLACRLAKCFSSGMQRNRLLTIEQNATKHRIIEENINLTLHSNSETNEQQPPSSCTLSDDLLTPRERSSPLIFNFIDLLSRTLRQPQQSLLRSDDLQRVESISFLFQRRIELAIREGLPWDPSMHATNFLQTLNCQSVAILRLLSFFKQIPEFTQLNIDDKVTLIKDNLMVVLAIYCTLLYNTETNQVIETDNDVPWNTQFFQVLHGYNLHRQIKKVFESLLNIAKYDQRIIQLTLIILILTKGLSTTDDYELILNDNMGVYRAQNYYTELLWKYMEAVHGSETAVQLFSRLVIHITTWQTIEGEMRNNMLRVLSPKDTDELLPIIKSVLRIS